ncbi:MAG: RDD family protein [Nitrospira sp.]|nr:RDD family protein [Nitrospira sp.]
MNSEIVEQFTNLLWTGIIALFIWWYYRDRAVPLSQKYSTFAPRFWTGFIDSSVLWPIGFVSVVILSFEVPRYLAALVIVAQSGIWLCYSAQMHARYGQTVGKMATKVRVVDFRTEGSISLWQAWLREGIPLIVSLGLLAYEIVGIMSGEIEPKAIMNGQAFENIKASWLLMALPGFWFLAELLTMLTNDKRRAIHDFIAGTVVVRINTVMESAQQSAPGDIGTDAQPPLS